MRMVFSPFKKSPIDRWTWVTSPMPCISGNFNPTTGPLMQVAITRLSVSAEESDAAEGVPTLHMFQALIDTGASSTCISSDVVSRVGLVPTGKTMMSGVTGQKPVDQYSLAWAFCYRRPRTRTEPLKSATSAPRCNGAPTRSTHGRDPGRTDTAAAGTPGIPRTKTTGSRKATPGTTWSPTTATTPRERGASSTHGCTVRPCMPTGCTRNRWSPPLRRW